ncbi:unnamed protein product [Callosobruchus maculatus]|uniref:Endonuclease/exonuclease/phosphatase domain-containing protein n=1 Tax=Callosobruchus maculatus TaxID=64391 RepID=A0A653CTM2_CALMS|nr:unnamed protein product [Callosobruchus maculatus]
MLLSQLDYKKNIIFTGDFNVKFNNNDKLADSLCDLFASFGMYPTVKENTRNNSCLDNVFTNINQSYIEVNVFDTSFSDHLAVSFDFTYTYEKQCKTKIMYRPITDEGLFLLHNQIENINWQLLFDQDSNIEEKFSNFLDNIVHCVDSCLPMKSKLVDKSSPPKIYWFDDELKQLREKLVIMKQFHQAFPELISREELNNLRNKYRYLIKIKRKNAVDMYINQASNKNLAMWNLIKQNGGKQTCSNKKSSTLNSDNFNEFFTNIAKNIVNQLPKMNTDRVNKMVDVVTTRVFDTYNRYSPLNNNHNESLASLSTLKRFSKDQRLKKVLTREADQKARDAQLFDIKENHPDVQLPRKRPFMGLSCQNCLLTSRVSSVNV